MQVFCIWIKTSFSKHLSLVIVVYSARRNSISLNWRVWLTYVLRQLKKPRLWFQGETHVRLPSSYSCCTWLALIKKITCNIFLFFAAWKADLKMMTFSNYLKIFRRIEVSSTNIHHPSLRAIIGKNQVYNINLDLLFVMQGFFTPKEFIWVKLWLSLFWEQCNIPILCSKARPVSWQVVFYLLLLVSLSTVQVMRKICKHWFSSELLCTFWFIFSELLQDIFYLNICVLTHLCLP